MCCKIPLLLFPLLSFWLVDFLITKAKSLIAPLDRIKILFQTGNPQFRQYSGSINGMFRGLAYIWSTSSIYGLFQGHSATLLRIFPYAAIKFVAYDQIRDHLIPSKQEEIWYRRVAAGSLAGDRIFSCNANFLGCTSVLFTYPLELVRVRLAFETQNQGRVSIRALCSNIYHERDRPIRLSALPSQHHFESLAGGVKPVSVQHSVVLGIANFYRGFIPTIAGMIPYAGVSFWAHDWAGDILRSRPFAKHTLSPVPPRNEREARHPKLKHHWEAVAGAAAGLLGQTASYPIEVVRRRMQVGGAIGNREMKGFMETIKTIYSTGGLRGFYVGLSIGYIKV